MLSEPTRGKIVSVCQQFSLTQHITEPTHYTENSASLLDIIMVSNNNSLHLSGVGDPFLSQDLRFHCPVFGILNFSTPKAKSFERHEWLYNQDDYDLLREKASTTDWESFKSPNIDLYAEGITKRIKEIPIECFPNKIITVKPSSLPWIAINIKKLIHKRKRLFRKARQSNDLLI